MNKKTYVSQASSKKENRRHGVLFLSSFFVCIVFLIFSLYFPTIKAPFIHDDYTKIINNSDIRTMNVKTLFRRYASSNNSVKSREHNDPSRPIVSLSFMINYYFGKLNPTGYHIVNILLHCLVTFILFLFFKELLSMISVQNATSIALFSCLLFAVHPVNSFVVSYTYPRSTSLSAIFYIFSLYLFVSYFYRRKRIFFPLSIVSYSLALLTKQDAITLPVCLLLIDFLFISRNLLRLLQNIKYHTLFWGMSFLYLLWRALYLGGIGDLEAIDQIDRVKYLLNVPYAYFFYFKSFFIPTGLSLQHIIQPLSSSFQDFRVIGSVLFILTLLCSSFFYYKFKDNDISRMTLYFTLWYFIFLVPTSSIIPTTRIIADNRMYMSLIGFNLIFYLFIFKFRNISLRTMWILSSIPLVAFSLMTINRANIYADPIKIWNEVIYKYPFDSSAHYNLGLTYFNRNNIDKAAHHYEEALKIDPTHKKAVDNLGMLYVKSKRLDDAISLYREILKITPDYVSGFYNLGVVYQLKNDHNNAVYFYSEYLKKNPNDYRAYHNLGDLYLSVKAYHVAIKNYSHAIGINPNSIGTLSNIGLANYYIGNYEKSWDYFSKVLGLMPGHDIAREYLSLLQKKL